MDAILGAVFIFTVGFAFLEYIGDQYKTRQRRRRLARKS